MRRTMGIAIAVFLGCLGIGTHSAYAICTAQDCPGGPPPPPPPPPTCPTIAPIPSNSFVTSCLSNNMSRCADEITSSVCDILRNQAQSQGYITPEAASWLAARGYCPAVYDMGDGWGTRLRGVCRWGCFAEDTEMLTGFTDDGQVLTTPAAQITAADTLMSMADESSFVETELVPRAIGTPVHGEEKPPLFVFVLGNGSTLRVTQHHPMVLASGLIVEAAQVETGASFVGIDGKPVAVRSISRERATGDVYNFETASDTQLGHIIVAEGVLVGDLKLQNDLAREQSSIELRR